MKILNAGFGRRLCALGKRQNQSDGPISSIADLTSIGWNVSSLSYLSNPSKLFKNHVKHNPLFMPHSKERFPKRRVSKNPKLLTRSHHVSFMLATREIGGVGSTR